MLTDSENDIQMSLDEFIMIRDFIHEKSGIYFAENKMYLVKNRLIKRMAELGIKNIRDYFYHVKYDVSLKEFNQLMNLVTTNETSFFRNEPQLLSFSEEVLPLLVKEKLVAGESKTLKIWSAGCSSGEEPYTLAIILLEKMILMPGWNLEILANDISESVLQRARNGEYSGITLRNVAPAILNRYFTKVGEMYRINPEAKSLVKFFHMNLNEGRRMNMMTGVDVIFFRNVMIYFSDEVKKQIIRGFYNSLKPGGFLYIGHSETLHGLSKAFRLVYFKNALVYRKEIQKAEKEIVHTTVFSGTAASTAGAAGGAKRAMDLLNKIKPMSTVNK
ncbi:MAG: protein-glutamate O-methyltransferase CheR [candidate division Zixibacteria bacterium]|nr:protein-glutamate O-methyltransferase CheR [candidate division Zixibacteria bacterium]